LSTGLSEIESLYLRETLFNFLNLPKSDKNFPNPAAEEAKFIGSIPNWRRKLKARLDFEVIWTPPSHDEDD
jgi:hypothetical protein